MSISKLCFLGVAARDLVKFAIYPVYVQRGLNLVIAGFSRILS